MTHLLDSSAWLAHLFGEPGVEDVNILFDDANTRISISVLFLPEVFARLKSVGKQELWPELWASYSELFSSVIPVDLAISHESIQLCAATIERLPTIDALIAGTALVRQLILVHRDPHMTAILNPDLQQLRLPNT